MNLPDQFSFSQQNLQDYTDCRYRFLLKYFRHMDWPAVESEPVILQEARMEAGQQFHRLVQQYFAGVDKKDLTDSIPAGELSDWWQEFLTLNLNNLNGEKSAEKLISIPFMGYRFIAKYDLLVSTTSDRHTIYDWKTSQSLASQKGLLERMQSIMYPFVLVSWLRGSTGENTPFPQVEMIYWYPSFPENPVQFTYTKGKFEEDGHHLASTVSEILALDEDEFVKTPDLHKCNYCRYRSWCGRGTSAGVLTPEMDEPPDSNPFEIDFDSL